MLVHFGLKHFLDRPSKKVFEGILNILCRLDVVFFKQHSYDIFLSLTHRFSFPSCHKKSASCVIISILSQFADFLQTFFQRLQTDFSSDCMKMTQEYLMYFKKCSLVRARTYKNALFPSGFLPFGIRLSNLPSFLKYKFILHPPSFSSLLILYQHKSTV